MEGTKDLIDRLRMSSSPSSGKALIELIIVIPLIYIVLAGGWELSRWIVLSQQVEKISSEAAQLTFKHCADFWERPDSLGIRLTPTIAHTESCIRDRVLNNSSEGIGGIIGSLFPTDTSLSVLVSLVRYDSLDGGLPTPYLIGPIEYPVGIVERSRFSLIGTELEGPGVTISSAELLAKKRVVITEVQIDFSPSILPLSAIPTNLRRQYHVSIY